jgi:hypothetical protein
VSGQALHAILYDDRTVAMSAGCRAFAADKFTSSRHLIDIDILFLTKEEASMKLGQ